MPDEQQCTPDTGNTKRVLEGRTTQRNSGNLPILFTSNFAFMYTYRVRNHVLFECEYQLLVLAYYYHQSWYHAKPYQDAFS